MGLSDRGLARAQHGGNLAGQGEHLDEEMLAPGPETSSLCGHSKCSLRWRHSDAADSEADVPPAAACISKLCHEPASPGTAGFSGAQLQHVEPKGQGTTGNLAVTAQRRQGGASTGR